MAPQRKVRNSQVRNRTAQVNSSYQTNLSAWKAKPSNSKSTLKQNNTVKDCEHAHHQAEDALQITLEYFEKGKDRSFSL